MRARRVKERLRSQQQSLRQRLERLLGPAGSERLRADSLGADSLDSSRLSEHSGSDGGQCGERGSGCGGVLGWLPGADPRCRAQKRPRWMWRARCSARSCRRWPPSAPGGTTATPAPAGPGPDSAAFRTLPTSSCWKCRCRPRHLGTGHRGTPGRAGHGAANGPRCAQQSTSRRAEEALAASPAVAGTRHSLKLPAARSAQPRQARLPARSTARRGQEGEVRAPSTSPARPPHRPGPPPLYIPATIPVKALGPTRLRLLPALLAPPRAQLCARQASPRPGQRWKSTF